VIAAFALPIVPFKSPIERFAGKNGTELVVSYVCHGLVLKLLGSGSLYIDVSKVGNASYRIHHDYNYDLESDVRLQFNDLGSAGVMLTESYSGVSWTFR
jgi:hypothetical protein